MLGFRLFFIGILASAVVGAGVYVMKLRSDNAILKANAVKMESAITEQKELITQQKEDFKEILAANQKMNELVSVLKKDLEDLDKRFNKKNRDVGKLAIAKTKSIERITNGASALATRCIEIASGSPLTEKEKNATKKSEINTECPSIANPNYVPY
jgi:chromosome segregation ATPase